MTLPTAPTAFSDGWSTGSHGTVFVGGEAGRHVMIGLGVSVSRLSLKTESLGAPPGVSVDGGAVFLIDPSLVAKIAFVPWREDIVPYGTLGFGLLVKSIADATISSGTSTQTVVGDTKVGGVFSPGIGIAFRVGGGLALFVEARLGMDLSKDNTKYVPITAGILF